MLLLRNVAKFTEGKSDLKSIYITFIRPVLEQSSPVWHSNLTNEDKNNLERVQKSAVRLIMGHDYKDYETSLDKLKLPTLSLRRNELCRTFAKRTLLNTKMRHMFPLRNETRELKRRKTEKYKVNRANTERYKNSSIPFMQHLLNQETRTD